MMNSSKRLLFIHNRKTILANLNQLSNQIIMLFAFINYC